MKPLSTAALKQLRLAEAVSQEAEAVRNLLPTEPGWDRLSTQQDTLVEFCRNRLKAGFRASPEVELSARKPGRGSNCQPDRNGPLYEPYRFSADCDTTACKHPLFAESNIRFSA